METPEVWESLVEKTKSEVTIERSEFINLFNGIRAQICNVVLLTEPKMNKGGNPYFGEVVKLSSRNYRIGGNYSARVKNNLIKEGKIEEAEAFEAQQSVHGKHINSVILFKEEVGYYYMELEYFVEVKPVVSYSLKSGDPIEKKLFEAFLPKSGSASQGGLVRKVEILRPFVNNIQSCTISGVKYILTGTVGNIKK